ncbi:hypothetical protein [Pedobacter sp. KBW01]|uniref:hypothetical protein n=1 Tax=Pedobacter sp. KBW01 TaxID=2153364 RepID=UPI000F5B39B9|nr:hypothetical protein [Pedobacter sp. KBW01]
MMKNAFKTTAFTLLIISVLMACKKKADAPLDFTIDEQNLTECPQGANCSFLYADNAAMIGNNLTLTKGQYRIFWVRSQGDGRTYWLYMQAPMLGDKFLLSDADVKAGKVKYVSYCAACYGIDYKAIGGTVKGIKIAKTDSSPEKWLIEARVGIGAEGATEPVSTVVLKQYYLAAVE